ncbi:MAG: peptidase M16, partial [Chitinivibrionales bacterium]|nr:peptidase M16 [Chitinivibrionales bacterium]
MSDSTFTSGNTIHGFAVERVQDIPELLCTARIMRHVRTGARLIHLVKEDRNNLFCCGFRTPVYDSTGVPHILEHSVLGGSRKFPVKDPFQQLLKSSLQTFLNALTYPDKTLYPVGSQVESDFYNLVDVYCDAVFHPRLTEHTFYQEGWHFDLPDRSKPVDIKGIVYNEMKGVFSDFNSHVGRRALSGLYPDTTYFFESGGEPEHIPELTYEAFKAFHSRYYHPSNAFIFLYGDNPTEKTLAFLEENYLGAFDRIDIDSRVHRQPSWTEPRTMTIEAPAPPEDQGTASVDVCWLFGDSTDPVRSLAGTVLARYLIGAESSPLRRALIDSGLGEDLDVLCGFDNELVQSMFAAGLRKTRPEHAERIQQIVFDTLRGQAEGGLDEELLEGSLRQTEFSLREISDAGRWPYSLKLADRCYRSWLYEGDPLAHLAFEQTLDTIRHSEGSVRAFFEKLLKEALLDNTHHLLMTVKASPDMGKRLERQTEEQAARLSGTLSDTDLQRTHRLTLELMEEQKRRPSPEELATLPRVTKADLPRRNVEVPTEIDVLDATPFYAHPLFCGGITYLDIGFECADMPAELVPYLPLYCELATRCGAGKYTYEQMATRISLSTGGIGAGVLLDLSVEDSTTPLFKIFYHGKSLARRVGEMTGIMEELFTAPKLDDTKLIGDILREMRNDHNASIIGAGHSYAALNAASRLNAVRGVSERISGIEQLRFLDRLVKGNDLAAVAEKMKRIHGQFLSRGRALLSVTADDPAKHRGEWDKLLASLPPGDAAAPGRAVLEPP